MKHTVTTASLTYCGKLAGELWKDTYRQGWSGDLPPLAGGIAETTTPTFELRDCFLT